ncbi:MAG: hypothetical protein ACK5BU_06975 [Bacteroidota bacterium]|jgi:hypothetical protein|nr:hypothetical protein [Terrimonas sp.]
MTTQRTSRQQIQTILVILLALLIGWKWTSDLLFFYFSVILSVVVLFSERAMFWIDFLWMKLTWLLSLIIPRIILSLLFYLFLTPLALLSRIFGDGDPLQMKKPVSSMFRVEEPLSGPTSFEKMW